MLVVIMEHVTMMMTETLGGIKHYYYEDTAIKNHSCMALYVMMHCCIPYRPLFVLNYYTHKFSKNDILIVCFCLVCLELI